MHAKQKLNTYKILLLRWAMKILNSSKVNQSAVIQRQVTSKYSSAETCPTGGRVFTFQYYLYVLYFITVA